MGPQSSAICCLSLALALGTPTSSLARAGSARNHVWQGPQRLSPVSSLASVCLGPAKAFCFAPFRLHFLPPRGDC